MLAGVSSGVALGDGSYGVQLSVPKRVAGGSVAFTVTAQTPVPTPLKATVIVYASSTHACAATAREERELGIRSAQRVFARTYEGELTMDLRVNVEAGTTTHLCAYVYEGEQGTLAHAAVSVSSAHYAVKFTLLPKDAVAGKGVGFMVEFSAPRKAWLVVFRSLVPGQAACAATAEGEKRIRTRAAETFKDEFNGGPYHKGLGFVTGRSGTYHLCAYVYEVEQHTLARAAASFQVK
jgi:hypothetical protein